MALRPTISIAMREFLEEIQAAQSMECDDPVELRRRQAAQTGLLPFVEYTTQAYQAGAVHKAVTDALDAVERREIDRLMILSWPQSGKSHIASKRYPAYVLGRDPKHDVISASAAASLAESFGRDVRNCVGSEEYRRIFPGTTLAPDRKAMGSWGTEAHGSYFAVGVGGAVMGRGATRLIIDDPFASMEAAQSELERNRVWDWYRGTLYNRVRPGGAIVLIQHRMHEEDLAGRLLANPDGKDRWHVVELPAIRDSLPLWPERFSPEALERIKANTPPAYWSALYLQNPVPEDGLFFKREWFQWYDPRRVPSDLRREGSADFAVTEGAGDFTSLGIHGISPDGDLYLVLDYYTGQTTADVWIDELCGMVLRHQPGRFYGEAGPIRRAVEPFMAKRMLEREAYCVLEWIASIHDKSTRARALQARASMGKVFLPDNEAGHRIFHQLLGFPMLKHDDDVDMVALFARAVDERRGGGQGILEYTRALVANDPASAAAYAAITGQNPETAEADDAYRRSFWNTGANQPQPSPALPAPPRPKLFERADAVVRDLWPK
jgi:hypothetical protein